MVVVLGDWTPAIRLLGKCARKVYNHCCSSPPQHGSASITRNNEMKFQTSCFNCCNNNSDLSLHETTHQASRSAEGLSNISSPEVFESAKTSFESAVGSFPICAPSEPCDPFYIFLFLLILLPALALSFIFFFSLKVIPQKQLGEKALPELFF